ncbi:unnamed protein product [Parnassius apollo]|uniref:(apollo) hypothetical protein n=1 Tax=Parnassius apollo TaxID=110799 RepID=A0A8S3X9N8_PARAO|nr:unnamed protein product [Parnassius apollo]
MNTKKHKSKNRAKLNLATAPMQENTKMAPEIEHTDLVKDIESNLKNEENVEKIGEINETLTVLKHEETIQKLDDVKETVADVTPVNLELPIKPKRNKGKKKKQIAREVDQNNKSEDNNKTDIIGNEEIISETNPINVTTLDSCSVQPSARKKKHKVKNPIGSTVEVLTDIECAVELSSSEKSLNMENKEDEIKDKFQIKNKKNKKKKRRHDSEKSEKAEDKISCTAAFDELVNTKNNNINLENRIEDSTPIQEIAKNVVDTFAGNAEIKSTIEDLSEKNVDKEVDIDTQKKKKKEKKHPKPKNVNKILSDMKNEDETFDVAQTNKEKSTTHSSLQSSILKEPKSKVIIATPVQICMHNQDNTVTTESDSVIMNIENTLFEKNISKSTPSSTNRTKDSSVQLTESSQLSLNPEKNEYSVKNVGDIDAGNTPNVFEIEKADETANFLDNIKQVSDKEQESDYKFETEPEKTNTMEFGEDNVGKELNYQSKEISNATKDKKEDIVAKTISETELIHESIINKQDTFIQKDISHESISDEFYDNTPDFIHIPRSSSQQLLDDNNNNNMDIREITSSDEIKLGIPVLTSNIIRDSGETPVSTPIIVDTGIIVTEVESIPNKEEKTDLKSKMMEVNQDLEELKMSLDKSLAELNAIEKDNQNCENKLKSYEVPETKTHEINKPTSDIPVEATNIFKPLADRLNEIENKFIHVEEEPVRSLLRNELVAENLPEVATEHVTPPVCPSRKDRKGKVKTKKRGRREPETISQTANVTTETQSQETKSDNKSDEKPKSSDETGKQKDSGENDSSIQPISSELHFEPIENFEDALSTSVDDVDVNKKFEVIANELNNDPQDGQLQKESFLNNPEINITPPSEDVEKDATQKNPVSEPKNLLGHPEISVSSSKTDYKKEKNKTPNSKQAKVKIKDGDVDIELDNVSVKKSKQSQTDSKFKISKHKNEMESFSYVTNEKEEYVYKYSFRKVFLASICHVCRKDLKQLRLPCKFCNLVFYCNQKHKDEDWPRHQSLCFAVSTIVHLKDQKHIYADAKNMSGQNYRLIRMQMILSCEKVLKRKLLPWEQEALLYPRICADVQCREWRQSKLKDCEGCGQVSYCIEHPEHLSPNHQRWCKSYALYQKMVLYQQSKGRLMPKLPGKVMMDDYVIPEKINEVLASMYDEKIDMSDIQYAALTQLATAPLTAAYCHQIYRQAVNYSNGVNKRSTFTIHAVGADLQFEADSLNKWEVFFLHLKPDVKDLRVALIGTELNPSNLPLDLLGKMKLCDHCHTSKRRVQFSFQDKSYHEYWSSDDFTVPDIVCAFNPNIQRSSSYNETNAWPSTINCIMKQKIPFLITSHSLEELKRDLEYIDKHTELNYKVISEAKNNPYASVRPDRNFVTDEETPLLFKNNCFVVLCGF